MWPFHKKAREAAENRNPHKKNGRPTKEMAAEKRRQRIQDMEAELKVKQLEAKMRAIENGDEERPIDMPTIERVVKWLAVMGFAVVPKKGGHFADETSGSIVGELRALVRDVASSPAGVEVVRSLAAGATQASQSLPSRPAESAQIAAPPEAATAPAVAPQQPSQPQVEEPPMSQMSAALIRALDGKSPSEAAQWFLHHPGATQLVAALKQTEPENLRVFLDSVAGGNPDLAGFVHWLLQRWEWTVDTIRIIKDGSSPAVVMKNGGVKGSKFGFQYDA